MLGMRFVRFGATAFLTGGLFSGVPGASAAQTQTAASGSTYVVVYNQSAVPADAAGSIARAGGSLVQSYDAIGVAIASSSSAQFRQEVRKDTRVDEAAPTANFGVRLKDRLNEGQDGVAASSLASTPATDSDSLSGLQWDMRQIKAPEAHAITGGSPLGRWSATSTPASTTTTPTSQPNVDFADSANCVSGAAVPRRAAERRQRPRHAHGRHHRRGRQRHRDRRRRAQRAHRRHQGRRRRRLLLPRGRRLRVHVGGRPTTSTSRTTATLPIPAFQLQERPGQRAIWTAERAPSSSRSNGVLVVAAEGNAATTLPIRPRT